MCYYYPSRCLVNFKLTFEAVDFFLVTYFLILKQTNMVNTEESCWLFFFLFFFEQLKNNRVKQRGSWAE